MASTAALGGRDRGVGSGRAGGTGGPRGERIVTPNGEGRGGGNGGGGGEMRVEWWMGAALGAGAAGGAGRCAADVKERAWDLDEVCRKICTVLKEDCKVNFLALDFDLTIVDIHTSGRWPGTPEQLAQRIRPFFSSLIPAALAHGIYVGIVTFSPQVSMISRVLKVAFPDIAGQIPIRGDDFSWDYEGLGSTDGKQSHMASAVEELTQTHAASITRASTLLIDDDANNVNIALSEGVKSVWCNPKDLNGMIVELISLGGPRENKNGGVGTSRDGDGSGAGGGGGEHRQTGDKEGGAP